MASRTDAKLKGPSDEPASPLAVASKGPVRILTLNRPDKLNALDEALRRALFAEFSRFEQDASAQVAILTGAGRAFCAGADLKEMSAKQVRVPTGDYIPHLNRNIAVTKPVIAAVNGGAYAGGFLLAQSCDLCVATEAAEFGINEVKVGRGAPWAAPLASMLPQRIMMELLLTGAPLPARRAYELGFVNKLAKPDDLMGQALDLAYTIADNAPLTVRAGKRLTYAAANMGRDAGLSTGDLIYEPVYLSEDALEGPRAFAQKRKPIWSGR